jgi:O-phosphoseryl-tRNA synthetase
MQWLEKMWDPEKIKKLAKQDYEKVWLETANLLKRNGRKNVWKKALGRTHPVNNLIEKFRGVLHSYEFEEVVNPSIVPEDDVRRQYGSEAGVILDRIFYLAGLPRPDIGISREKTSEIQQIVPKLVDNEVKKLQKIFREYKEGKIEGDNLVEEMINRLDIKTEDATTILSLFPELTKLAPIPTKLTLRSHMTALWFSVLEALQDKKTLPMKLFSIGKKYRREQKLDKTHLYESYVASIVVMAEDITLEDGVELTRSILSEIGLKNAKFELKKATSKYYAPKMEMEVFTKSGNQWIEVGDIGLYSPVSLAQYDICYPVFNAGLGVERIAMLLHGITDIRKVTYPQFYAEWKLSDTEIAKMVMIDIETQSKISRRIREAIKSTALKNANELSPCEFLAYEGKILKKTVKVYIYETDSGVELLGPAALNHIYVYNGNILGIPEKGMDHQPFVRETRERGVSVGFSYLDATSSLAAAKIEEGIKLGLKEVKIRVKIAKQPSDINIKINNVARRYITGKRTKIDTAGPIFIGIRAEIN